MSMEMARAKINTFPQVPLDFVSTTSRVLWGGRTVWKSAGAPHWALGIICSPLAPVLLWYGRPVWKSAGAPQWALGIICSPLAPVLLGPAVLGPVVPGPANPGGLAVLGAEVLDPLMLKYLTKLQGSFFFFNLFFSTLKCFSVMAGNCQ